MIVVELGQVIEIARRRAGLTLRELATRAGTSAATLHAYEHELKEPSLSVARRIVRAAGFDLDVELVEPAGVRRDGPDETFKLELDRLIAEHLIEDRVGVLQVAAANIERARAERPAQEQPWVDEWEHLLDGPVLGIVELLLAVDPESMHLKQAAPFAGVLSDDERLAAMSRARARRREMARAS